MSEDEYRHIRDAFKRLRNFLRKIYSKPGLNTISCRVKISVRLHTFSTFVEMNTVQYNPSGSIVSVVSLKMERFFFFTYSASGGVNLEDAAKLTQRGSFTKKYLWRPCWRA